MRSGSTSPVAGLKQASHHERRSSSAFGSAHTAAIVAVYPTKFGSKT